VQLFKRLYKMASVHLFWRLGQRIARIRRTSRGANISGYKEIFAIFRWCHQRMCESRWVVVSLFRSN